MEINMGTAVSIISENQRKELFPDATLHTSRMTYTSEWMAVKEEWDVQVQYCQQSKTLWLQGMSQASLEETG